MPNFKKAAATHYKIFCGAVFTIGVASGALSQVVLQDQFLKHEEQSAKEILVNRLEIRKIQVKADIKRQVRLVEAFNNNDDKRELESLQRQLILLEKKINS